MGYNVLSSSWYICLCGCCNCLSAEMASYIVNVIAGGPSGSGKTSLAHKMANIVGCEVVSLESYYKPEHVKDFKCDDFNSLDLSLLSKVKHHTIDHFALNCISFVLILLG